MSIAQMLDQGFAEELVVEVESGFLQVSGPRETVQKYAGFLKEHKAEILEYLGPDPSYPESALEEYDRLIHEHCDNQKHSPAHRARLLAARRSMAPANLLEDLEAFRQIVNQRISAGKS